MNIMDYQIIQRDANNQATVTFEGPIPVGTGVIFARVFREEDNLQITPFEKCNIRDNYWEITFTLPAGGLYCFEARVSDNADADPHWSRRFKIVRHFGVGDLYLLTGQSNMAGYGRDVAYDPPALGVHLYANSGRWDVAAHPLNDSVDTIYPENREECSATSPALSFARTLKEHIGVPVGLVQASLGGSPLSLWHPEEDGMLYRGMMRRIDVVGNVKGILWYQGCSDANEKDAPAYYDRFKRMVELWREQLGDVPVITVQLNRWAQGGQTDLTADRCWGMIRDAQRRIADDVAGVSVVSTMDLPLTDGIHNSAGANILIGCRMAMTVLKEIYGQPGLTAPAVRACTYVDETHLMLTFDEGMLMNSMDGLAAGMDVEDESGLIACRSVVCKGNTVCVETERPYTLPAKFHAYWRCNLPVLVVREYTGMPMLACYNVEITKD